MKTLPLSLFVFATVFLFSSALRRDTGNDGHGNLIDSNEAQSLQRRKPPGKIPGPKLVPGFPFLAGFSESKDKAKKQLSDGDKKQQKGMHLAKDGKQDSMATLNKFRKKGKSLANNPSSQEETQQERSQSV